VAGHKEHLCGLGFHPERLPAVGFTRRKTLDLGVRSGCGDDARFHLHIPKVEATATAARARRRGGATFRERLRGKASTPWTELRT